MVIGSHNTWSFLKASPRWCRLFSAFFKCQERNVAEQYYYCGIRCFDLRLRKGPDGEWWISHGLARFCKLDPEDLAFLNRLGDTYVRVTLEYNKEPKNSAEIIQAFDDKVKSLVQNYPNIKWFGGRAKWCWKVVVDLPNSPSIVEKHASVCGNNWLSRILPGRWARKHNKEVLQEGTTAEILMIDFV